MVNNQKISKIYSDIFLQIESISKYLILSSVLAILLLLLGISSSEFNTILLVLIFEIISIFLSKTAIYFLSNDNNYLINKKDNILNSAIILGVHICTGLVILGVYIAQFSF